MEISTNIKLLIKKYNFKAQKHLGQNFLVNFSALHFISDYITKEPNRTYIEIGPGFANLTREVSKKAKFIYAIEKDERFKKFYEDYPIENVEFIISDALKINFDDFDAIELYGNIPYYITSDLVMKIARSKIERSVILLQDEFAKRLLAKPSTKEYGSITVFTQYFFDVAFVKRFPPNFFFPPPNVYSTLIELRRKRSYKESIEDFLTFIHRAFSFRRKKLITNLKTYYDKDFSSIFKNLNIEETTRPEELTVEKYFEIYENVVKF